MSHIDELKAAAMSAAPGFEAYIATSKLDGYKVGFQAALLEASKLANEILTARDADEALLKAMREALVNIEVG